MTELFLGILNVSFSATWVVLGVVLARLVMKKAPRNLVCGLWALVALRLLFGGIEAPFSLIPSSEIIPPESLYDQAPVIHSGVSSIDEAVNPVYSESLRPMPGARVNPLQVWLAVFANLWFLGCSPWPCGPPFPGSGSGGRSESPFRRKMVSASATASAPLLSLASSVRGSFCRLI